MSLSGARSREWRRLNQWVRMLVATAIEEDES